MTAEEWGSGSGYLQVPTAAATVVSPGCPCLPQRCVFGTLKEKVRRSTTWESTPACTFAVAVPCSVSTLLAR